MKIVGLTITRNDSWVLEASMRIALRWVDALVILDHASTDDTPQIIRRLIDEFPGRIDTIRVEADQWDEMHNRQLTLEMGREFKGDRFAIIDSDEIPTANVLPMLRHWCHELSPTQCLALPMIPMWRSLHQYRNDRSVWSRAEITLVFRDDGQVCWRPRQDGYQHHSRIPQGCSGTPYRPLHWQVPEREIRQSRRKISVRRARRPIPIPPKPGGVMHLQFADWRRLIAKHNWYRAMEHARWPGRDAPEALNRKYNQALDESGLELLDVPREWLAGCESEMALIQLGAEPWHERALQKMFERHGRQYFAGLQFIESAEPQPCR